MFRRFAHGIITTEPLAYKEQTMARAPEFDARTNSLQHKGASIPLPSDAQSGSRPAINQDFASKAGEIKATAIRYNPKLDPKYDARSSVGTSAMTQGTEIAFQPGAGMGHSLVGHELTHVVQQKSTR
jgi:Domain of unknown function (DUF4157)